MAKDTALAAAINQFKRELAQARASGATTNNAATNNAASNNANSDTGVIGVFTAAYSTAQSEYKLKNHWIIDSGSDIHVCNSQDGYARTGAAGETDQLIAGKTRYQIASFGTVNVTVNTPQGIRQIQLTNVAYIPGFMTNLVSLSRLVQQGVHWNTETGQLTRQGQAFCYITAFDGHWTLTPHPTPHQTPHHAPSETQNFVPQETLYEMSAFPAHDLSQPRPPRSLSASQWHNIMGHAGYAAIRHLP